MGFRFSRRITLMPGVRLNVGARGASLSVGPRGASVNIGKRGVTGTVGLPGTGLSYSGRLSGPKVTRPGRTPPARPADVAIESDAIVYRDEAGVALQGRDRSEAKRLQGNAGHELLTEEMNARNALFDSLHHVHHDIPITLSADSDALDAKPLVDDYASREAFVEALMVWRAARANMAASAAKMLSDLENHLSALSWPRETSFDLGIERQMLGINVDLPEIEDMPTSRWRVDARTSTLTQRALLRREVAALYVGHVASILTRVLGHAFAIVPSAEAVALSAYTQRRTGSGHLEDDHVVIAEVARSAWRSIDTRRMSEIDPEEVLSRVGVQLTTTASGVLRSARSRS